MLSRIYARYQSGGFAALAAGVVRRTDRALDAGKEWVLYQVARITAERVCGWHAYRRWKPWRGATRPVGMTTWDEQAFLCWYCAERYRHHGVIVELGPFVGASTIAMCGGLSRRSDYRAKHDGGGYESGLRVYDRFVCTPSMVECLKQGFGPELTQGVEVGSSCRHLFDLQTKEYAKFFTLHDGDLLAEKHDGAPVELLFIDAMKTPELANHIVRQFYPSLIPGTGVLVQQDFVHYYASWIHILQYRLRHLFRFVLHVPRSASAVFEVIATDPDLARFDLGFEAVTDDEVDAAFDYAISLIRGPYRENIHAAKAMFYVHRGRPEVARSLVDDYVRRHGRPRLEMQHVERALSQ